MSLFKLKNLWSAYFPEEQFDERHLSIFKLDNYPSIAIGSFKGVLRIFRLRESAHQKDLFEKVYEKDFQEPIIDLKAVMHPDESIRKNTLGVLLFKKFVYLTLIGAQDSNYSAKFLNVQVEPSFGIVVSPLALATVNSSLQYLNPKQIYQLKQADPIYPYAVSLNNFYYMDGEDLVNVEGHVEQWRIILGRVRSLHILQQTIIVIGQNDLWEVSEGNIRKCKRLEEEVSAGCLAHRSMQNYNIIVCNFMMQMLVYSSEYILLWAVKLDSIPIKMIVWEDQSLKGALILLTDQGSVEVSYAGTELQERNLKPIQNEVDMEKVERETLYFLQKIKTLQASPQQVKKQKVTEENSRSNYLSISSYFSQPEETQLFVDNSEQYYRSPLSNKLIKCILNLQLSTQLGIQLENIILSIEKPSNLYYEEKSGLFHLQRLKGKQNLKIDFYISKEKFPSEATIKINIRYEKGNTSDCVQNKVQIPMCFQCAVESYESMSSPEKKITFKCSQDKLPPFNDLFSDVMERGCGQQKKAITFRLFNGVVCSIIYNKTQTKVKIESDVYSGLHFIFLEFMNRMQKYHQSNNLKMPVEIQVSLKELEGQIREYYASREALKQSYKNVQTKTQQFKKTQKKLLLKMKEKNTSVNHIKKLLDFNYSRVLQSTKKYENLWEQSQIINHNFQIGLKFVMELVFWRSYATSQARKIAMNLVKFQSLQEDPLSEEGWGQRLTKSISFHLGKVYNPTIENLQKLVTWVITKVNNGQWNSL